MPPDKSISAVVARRTGLRSSPCVNLDRSKLVTTAKKPEIEMACPAWPSVSERFVAIGVSKLTGKNSEATNAKAQSDIARIELQTCRFEC
ncbi:hypothetical protein PPUJ20028_06390 [Pseudomonas putida]|uniref:Uncharacterized protein n=1 Tax=Pseudomonas putida TaxID=303 RepID=A0AA37RFB4_PSEPU|nr:hypothetical protein PPUJ20028_06390 [Pseudomonas putida]GLO35559.1 hypothetical protein PPUN14671_23920 [Pseudomonas putida]